MKRTLAVIAAVLFAFLHLPLLTLAVFSFNSSKFTVWEGFSLTWYRAIFHDPISGNIQWREIESLLRHLGAEIESLSGTRTRVKLNGVEGTLHRPHPGNALGRQDITHLREYLGRARITPSSSEESPKGSPADGES